MFKKLLFLSLCVISSMAAKEKLSAKEESLQIGRYQMINFGSNLYLLDTATGYVWCSKAGCIDSDVWELRISIPPEGPDSLSK